MEQLERYQIVGMNISTDTTLHFAEGLPAIYDRENNFYAKWSKKDFPSLWWISEDDYNLKVARNIITPLPQALPVTHFQNPMGLLITNSLLEVARQQYPTDHYDLAWQQADYNKLILVNEERFIENLQKRWANYLYEQAVSLLTQHIQNPLQIREEEVKQVIEMFRHTTNDRNQMYQAHILKHVLLRFWNKQHTINMLSHKRMTQLIPNITLDQIEIDIQARAKEFKAI